MGTKAIMPPTVLKQNCVFVMNVVRRTIRMESSVPKYFFVWQRSMRFSLERLSH